MKIDIEKLDEWLLRNKDYSQEERELIVEALEEFAKREERINKMKKDFPEAREIAREMTDAELKHEQRLHYLCRINRIGNDPDAERIIDDEIKRRKNL